MHRIIFFFFVCLLQTVVVCGQTATNTTALKTALQLKLDEWHKAGSFPGATLGVVLANGESFGLAVGLSDSETKTAMRPTDRMLAGSVGKTFAAATALQLIKEGKIGLDDKIEKYLGREPWFGRLPNARDITVRQLMNHTSGLVRYEFKDQFTKDLSANPAKTWNPAELVAYLLDEKPPFEAGKGWDYSDTNYIVLGMIIEKVTGTQFYDEANRRLLKPLKLTDTIPQDGPKLKGVVQGYAGSNNPFGGTDAMIVNGKFAINPQFEWTGGGYASTAQDLARWAKMIYEGKAFSPDLLPQVVDGVPAPKLGRESKYGLGVIIRKTPLGTSYGHSGFFPGYMTDMMYFPEHKIAVAVQVNTSVGRNLGKPLSRVLVEVMEAIRSHLTAQISAERKDGDLKFEPFTIPFEGQNVAAELGRLVVRENRSKPKTNLIELAFVRLKSTAERPGYPVVYLDGGPGSSAINIARAPDYMRAFMKLREVGDVILLDQRGVGRSKPNLTRLSPEALPLDVFADNDVALRAYRERTVAAATYFRSQGVDIQAYNTIESANDVDDVRKALGAEKLNLVGFSYGTHLGLACIRYHGPNLNRVVLIGTEGPDHTNKLPSTSDVSLKRLSELAAFAPELEGKVPDLFGMLREVLARFEKQPVTVQVTDQRTKKPVDLKIGKSGLQFLIMRDLGDTNDLPIFPVWFYTMHRGDYSILSRFAERRYNQFGAGISLMTVVMDASSGTTKQRTAKIKEEAKTALLGEMVNFPFPGIDEAVGNPDLGDKYRSPIHTSVPTLFISGTLDNNTPPFQADEVRRSFRKSTHLVVENAGHESMLVDARVQQTIVEYLGGGDVSKTKIALPPVKFNAIPKPKN